MKENESKIKIREREKNQQKKKRRKTIDTLIELIRPRPPARPFAILNIFRLQTNWASRSAFRIVFFGQSFDKKLFFFLSRNMFSSAAASFSNIQP